jgi:hypothetical protein
MVGQLLGQFFIVFGRFFSQKHLVTLVVAVKMFTKQVPGCSEFHHVGS